MAQKDLATTGAQAMGSVLAGRVKPEMKPSLAVVVGAVACGMLGLGGAIALPLLAKAESGDSIPSASLVGFVWWLVVALIIAQAVVLLWAGRFPRVVVCAVALIPVIHAIALPGATFTLTTVAVAFAVFWTAVRVRPRRFRVLLPVIAMLVAGSQALNDARSESRLDLPIIVGAVLQAVAIVGIPLVIGLFVAARNEARVSRENELLALRRERDALVQAAVSRERIAMSRELHDIAAHHMSGIALLASAIYRQVDLDPAAAKASAQQVRAQSTTVLDDLRRVIGLLRDEAESSRSVETLAAVGELVELRRAAGTDATIVLLTGDRDLGAGIGPLAQLVAYRMVQESLANSAVHAPGANCVVELDDRHADHLTVLVTNDGAHAPDPGAGSGFGLIGMRERAELVGADLEYGATAGGGWTVRLVLKRDASFDITRDGTA